MPTTPHLEKHFTAGAAVRDLVIGMSDGLTVPFALAAGLAGAVSSNWIIVTAGLAEVAAGSIAMGLGGYLAARSDEEHYVNEQRREEQEIVNSPEVEQAEIAELFRAYGVTDEESAPVLAALSRRPTAWRDFMMRFELGLEQPAAGRAWKSALTIAGAYAAGGLFPLAPYMIQSSAGRALGWSVVLTMTALVIFGYVKGRFTSGRAWRSAGQTALIGGIAAGAAFTIAKAIS